MNAKLATNASLSANLESDGNLTASLSGNEQIQVQLVRGSKGESAYEIALRHGFIGAEEDWLKSIADDNKCQIDKLINELNSGKFSRIKLAEDIDDSFESEKGNIYIRVLDDLTVKLHIGDGSAYIRDLPEYDLNAMTSTVQKLKEESVTAKYNDETLSLPYIFNAKG